jgi:type III secretion protein J
MIESIAVCLIKNRFQGDSTMFSSVATARFAQWGFWRDMGRGLLCLVVVCALTACKVDLFTKQTEADANQMVAALLDRSIDAEKVTPDSGKNWSVQVEREEVARALAVLKAVGLPQSRHASLGDLFKKEGLISSPTEERVRFIHGMTQELSSTIEQIDGVVTARVHVVLPNNDPLAIAVKPSSASVFVKYRPEANLVALTPSIKNLVARSVEGLTYDNVSVTMVAGDLTIAAPSTSMAAAMAAKKDGVSLWWIPMILLVLLISAAVFIIWKRPAWLPSAIASRIPASWPRAGGAVDAAPAAALPASPAAEPVKAAA